MRKRINISVRWLPAIASAVCSRRRSLRRAHRFNTTVPSQIMDQFRNQRIQWTTNVWVYANTLFGILAVIEFAWSAAVMLLEKSDLQSWTSALIRKLMWIGAFYALLLNGRIWIPAIIDSFTQIGQNAAGLGALSPSGVFMQGLSLAGALMDGASTSAFFTNPGTSLALAFAALLIVVSYTIITINFIVTLVESYLVVSVGFIFLGFGGSRWTAPYTERYIGLAVSIGIKIVLLYCLISAGFGLSLGWLDEAQGIATSARPAMTAFDVMGGSLIFMMCCWQIPKLFAAVIGGSPALTGGDLVATAAVVGGAALAVGGAAAAGVARIGGRRRQCGGGHRICGERRRRGLRHTTAVASVGSVGAGSSAGGGSVSPPFVAVASSAANGGGGADSRTRHQKFGRRWFRARSDNSQIASAWEFGWERKRIEREHGHAGAPPSASSALSSIGGEPLAGSGFETQAPQRGFAPASSGQPSQPLTGPTRFVFFDRAAEQRAVTLSLAPSSVEAAPGGVADQRPGSSGVVSDVASVAEAWACASPSTASYGEEERARSARVADQVRGLPARLGSVPPMRRHMPRHPEFQSITRSNGGLMNLLRNAKYQSRSFPYA
jgi:type IV secretion system protein TrbL